MKQKVEIFLFNKFFLVFQKDTASRKYGSDYEDKEFGVDYDGNNNNDKIIHFSFQYNITGNLHIGLPGPHNHDSDLGSVFLFI